MIIDQCIDDLVSGKKKVSEILDHFCKDRLFENFDLPVVRDPNALHSTVHVYLHGHPHDYANEWFHDLEDYYDSKLEEAKKEKPGWSYVGQEKEPIRSKSKPTGKRDLDTIGPFGLSYRQAEAATGGLGVPSKMPGMSYGTPAMHCPVGSKLHFVTGSTCSHCYGMGGNYLRSNVAIAMARRFQSLNHPHWVNAMATLISHHSQPAINRKTGEKQSGHVHFRWHDSGDIQSPQHLERIMEVARKTPNVKHWLPTREYDHVKKWVDAGGQVPANMNIRLSGHMIDQPHYSGLKGVAGIHHEGEATGITHSSVTSMHPDIQKSRKGRSKLPPHLRDAKLCPAPHHESRCETCRSCWDPNTGHIVYHQHGKVAMAKHFAGVVKAKAIEMGYHKKGARGFNADKMPKAVKDAAIKHIIQTRKENLAYVQAHVDAWKRNAPSMPSVASTARHSREHEKIMGNLASVSVR